MGKLFKWLRNKRRNLIIVSKVEGDDIKNSVVIGSKVNTRKARVRKLLSFGSRIDVE